ncbi:helix-turn-helix domain-containing protein [Paracoccus sp. YLB-12]|uniref:Helix-turn-helix domain-containing protein n=1 Tax=Paracoccus maritimus TaxID=2933292 RepID=A0ABT2KEG0_9RHOB|nr:helix-turn-helix domain-containing protein [Paracoccus sp. YLB-12]MCT4334929.1 helix-turn-helix domain-containing protein [Paracoccus sp. YLB-12]
MAQDDRPTTPNDRMLMVLEYLSGAKQAPVRQADMARDCGISPATLSRIINVLSEWGYVLRTNKNQVIGNFRFQRNVRMSESYQLFLNTMITEIGAQHNLVVEVIVNAGNDLFWQSSTAPSNRSFSLRAQPGFRRGLMELDVLSRLYLARLSGEQLRSLFDRVNFSTTGVHMKLLSEPEALEVIEAARPKLVDWDFDGNRQGIRRFATYITDPEGNFAHLLSLAEPATPTRDRSAHEAEISEILNVARTRLMQEMGRKSSSPPGRGNVEERFAG